MNGKLQFTFVRDFGLCSGDIANLYLGKVGLDTPVIVKVAKNEYDNDLLKTEGEVLKDLVPKLKDSWSYFVPQILDSFQVDSKNGEPKPWCNVLEFFPGFLDVESIRKLSTGVDGRTLVWMWKRLLGILSWVHHHGYIHGAVLPPHVMYWPDGSVAKDKRVHTVRLVDWCYAVDYNHNAKLKAWIPDYKDFYPPEVIQKRKIGPATDLYMAAMTMLYLAGGDVKAKKFHSRIPGQISNLIKKCLNDNYNKRPQDMGEYFDTIVATSKDVYGQRKFHEFKLPI